MATETFVIESALSAKSAFGRVIDLSRVPEWDRGIRESQLIEGSLGSVGARYELTLKGFDQELTTAVYELTAVVDNRSFTMVGTHPDFRAEDALTFEPTNDGCLVTYAAGLVLLGNQPPLTEAQLDNTFGTIVAVARKGLGSFLNS